MCLRDSHLIGAHHKPQLRELLQDIELCLEMTSQQARMLPMEGDTSKPTSPFKNVTPNTGIAANLEDILPLLKLMELHTKILLRDSDGNVLSVIQVLIHSLTTCRCVILIAC